MLGTATPIVTAAHNQQNVTQFKYPFKPPPYQTLEETSEQFLQGPLGQIAARESRILSVDQDQQYKITIKIEGKAERTAKVYKFICPIFRLDKTKN